MYIYIHICNMYIYIYLCNRLCNMYVCVYIYVMCIYIYVVVPRFAQTCQGPRRAWLRIASPALQPLHHRARVRAGPGWRFWD
jgi:uncharacterized protein YggT (Ycf19 family)